MLKSYCGQTVAIRGIQMVNLRNKMTKDEEKIIKMLRNKEEIMSLERFRRTVQKIKVIEIRTEHSEKKSQGNLLF